MQYYDFYRHYSVPGRTFKEARITFSRALEDNEQERYYLDTTYGFSTKHTNQKGILENLLTLVPWFLEEVRNQIVGYPKYHH